MRSKREKGINDIEIEVYEPVKRETPGSEHFEEPAANKKFCGLYNRGNTCYLNSLLQSLFMTQEFRFNILQWEYNEAINSQKEDCIPFQIQKLFARMQLKCRDTEETEDLTKSFQWDHYQLLEQHDIQELCRVLFDAIERSLTVQENNFIETLYQGEAKSVVKCLECDYISEKMDRFLDISLPVRSEIENVQNTSLEMALCNFLSKERLEKENKYLCSQCNKKVDAEKYIQLIRLPKILFIQLNRFEYDYLTDSKRKICDRVTFPLVLDMSIFLSEYENIQKRFTAEELRRLENRSGEDDVSVSDEINSSNMYELFSVVAHAGSARGGHYFSYIKSFEDGQWYRFDDTMVYESSQINLISTFGEALHTSSSVASAITGYILMYRRIKNCSSTSSQSPSPMQMTINHDLLEFIQKENILIHEEEERQKERQKNIQLKFICNGQIISLIDKKTSTIKELKLRIMKEYGTLFHNVNQHNARIRCIHHISNKMLDSFKDEDKTLEEYNFMPSKTYTIEVKKDDEVFEEYNPDEICLNLILWDEAFVKNDIEERDFKFEKVKIDKKSKLSELRRIVYAKYNLESSQQIFIFKKVEYGATNYLINEIPFADESEMNKEIHLILSDGTKIFLEVNDRVRENNIQKSHFLKLFDQKCATVSINFNFPITDTKSKKITIKSYTFDNKIEMKKTKTLSDVKNHISEILNIPCNKFIMKKNSHNGNEMKNLSEPIEKYTTSGMNIYIEYGNPQKDTEIKLKLFLCEFDFSFFLVFPYKLIDNGLILVNSTWTINELKKHLISEKLVKNEGVLLIREYKNDRPAKIYHDSSVLSKDLGLKEGCKIIAQCVTSELLDVNYGAKDIQVTVREWDPSKWRVSNPFEVTFPKGTTVIDFVAKLNLLFPGISLENMSGFKIMNEVNIYMDDLKKAKYTNLLEHGECLVENFPLFINTDGCMLIIKDISKIPREPNPEEISLYCKPVKPCFNTDHLSISSSSSLTSTTSSSSKVSLKTNTKTKEKALIIKVKKNCHASITPNQSTNTVALSDNGGVCVNFDIKSPNDDKKEIAAEVNVVTPEQYSITGTTVKFPAIEILSDDTKDNEEPSPK